MLPEVPESIYSLVFKFLWANLTQNDGADKVISISAPGYFIWGKGIISESAFSNKFQELIQTVDLLVGMI